MSEIRSVSVRLDADVASYIAKMKLAGEATDQAFGSSTRNIDSANSKLSETEQTLGGVESAAKKAERSVGGLDRTLHRSSSGSNSGIVKWSRELDGFIGKLGAIPSLAAALGPALVPLGATALGGGLALGGPLGAAGLGAAAFAVTAGVMIKQANDAEKKLTTADAAVAAAHQSLVNDQRNYKANSATVTNAEIRYNQALAARKVILQSLTPAQKEFAKAKDAFSLDFQKLTEGRAGQAVFGTVVQGLKLAGDLLPSAAPLLISTSNALDGLLGDLGRFTGTREFKDLNGFFSHESGVAIGLVGQGVGNIALGFGHLFQDLTPTGNHLLRDFVHYTDGFAGGKSLTGFLGYVHQIGPDTAHTVGDLARATGHFVQAIAPLGPPVLHIIDGLARGFDAIPLPVLTALAGTAGSLVALQKVGGFKVPGLVGKAASSGLAARIAGYFGFQTGKGSKGVGDLLAGGVQKVYVVNLPPGLDGPGGPGGGGDWVSKTGVSKWGGPAAAGGAEAATAGAGTVAAAAAALAVPIVIAGFAQRNIFPYGRAQATDPGVARGGRAAEQHYNVPAGPAEGRHDTGGTALSRGYSPVRDAVTGYGPSLKSTATQLDAVRSHAAQAEQNIELMGPKAEAASAQTVKALDVVLGKLEQIHPTRLQVIAETQSAVNSLEALQRLRIQDKSFNVYAHYERAVGPGGGIGHPGSADGGTIGGPRYPYCDKVIRALAPGEEVVSNRFGQADMNRLALKAANRGARLAVVGHADGGTVGRTWNGGRPVTSGGAVRFPSSMRMSIELKTPWGPQTVEAIAQQVYDDNRDYERTQAGG